MPEAAEVTFVRYSALTNIYELFLSPAGALNNARSFVHHINITGETVTLLTIGDHPFWG